MIFGASQLTHLSMISRLSERESERIRVMSKTPFSKRVEILCDFYINYSEDESLEEGWKEYFSLFDIGLPLAFMAQVGIAEPTEEGKEYIDKAWEAYCNNLGINSEEKY